MECAKKRETDRVREKHIKLNYICVKREREKEKD